MDQSVYLLRNKNRLTKERVSIVTLKPLVSSPSNDFNSYPLEKITATFFRNDFLTNSLKKFVCFLQIFKSAEELDLGCGVGGGKDNKDIFKVSEVLEQDNLNKNSF